jgi:hypothetical protein
VKSSRAVKWAQLGDENTKFFHANATIKHNKNSTQFLEGTNGQPKFGHKEKAAILWEAYKERLNSSEFSHMYFKLDQLIQEVDGLESLDAPFSPLEIVNVVNNLPLGKSLGPDGFNSDFIKKVLGCDITGVL